MHKISWTIIALLSLSFNVLAQSDVSKARRKSKEIVIDGNDREWTKPLNFYDDKTGLLFAICNDKNNLYFAFTCSDELKMRKLMSAGWSVELSSKEKNKKFNSTLIFPAVKMEGMGRKRSDYPFEKKVAGNPFITAYQSQLKTISAKGFQSNKSELQVNDRNGIDIVVGADSTQNIVYEIAIPLNELMVENSFQPDELITLNVTVNALVRSSAGGGDRGGQSVRGGEMSDMSRGGMDGGMGGGRSGGGRGGMGGGRPDGMSRGGVPGESGQGDRSGLFERVSFKQKFTLAQN